MQNNIQYSENNSKSTKYNMNTQKGNMNTGDYIDQLPSDVSVPSHNEIRIIDQLFQEKKSMLDRILHQTKDIIILAGLFILFSLPFVDNLIKQIITVTTKSQYILICVKALIFVIIYFIIKNLYLVRKN